jgi:hypothetical protein
MAAYKISYFNLMGRAELSRLLLSAAGKEFEDDRFEKEEWPARKPHQIEITYFICGHVGAPESSTTVFEVW